MPNRDYEREQERYRNEQYGRGMEEDYGYGRYGRGMNERGYGEEYGRYGMGIPRDMSDTWRQHWGGRERDRDRDERGFFDRLREFFSSRHDERDARRRHGHAPKGYVRSDERIREDVCDRLMSSPWIDASEVEIRVMQGEVTLEGSVDTRDEKRQIEDITEGVLGVKDVNNRLRLSSRDDQLSAQRIQGTQTTQTTKPRA
jgi:BON domain